MSARPTGRAALGGDSGRMLAPIKALIEQFAPVAAELERSADPLIDRITSAIREEITSYQGIAYRGLRDAVSVHVRRALEAARGDATPSGADLEEAVAIGREAANFDLPVESLLQAIRVGVRIFWLECVQWAREHETDPETMIAAAELIWGWSDEVGLALVRGHREVAVEEAVARERERSAFLIALLEGSLAGAELRGGAERNGLALDTEYVPLCARAFGSARSAAQCERAIRHALGPTTEGIVVWPLEDELIGIVPRRPEIDDPEVVMGIGSAAPLQRIAPSYAEAVRALEVAVRFRLRGVFDLLELSLRAPVAAETVLGKGLVARYLGPLRDGSHAGAELEQTLRAFLDHHLRGESTARALGVHVNTLRNRLRRLEQLVGADLRDPARIAELWWALQYDAIAREIERDS